MTTVRNTPVALHRLTYVEDVDGVTVGRPETGSYAVLPPAGAALLRAVEQGRPYAEACRAYVEATGEDLDPDDFRGLLTDLGFLREPEEPVTDPEPPRWQALGRAAFSPVAWLAYAAVVVAGLAAVVAEPGLRPTYRAVFFTSHLSLIPILLALGQIPCLLVHEGYHALAGRRLGLPSRLGVGRRYYYIVAETRLDALYSVPRSQRYLPFLAGTVADLVLAAGFTLVAAGVRAHDGPSVLAGFALAMAFTSLMRVAWQGLFYLETDLYFVIATATRSTDLQGASRYTARRWLAAVLRRPRPPHEEFGPRDLRCARWYTPLLGLGYAVSTATLLLVALPTSIRFWTTVWHRLSGSMSLPVLLDTVFFVAMTLAQAGLFAYVTIRDRRAKRRDRRTRPTEGAVS